MCVLAFAWHAHPDWPLVLVGNRDERHDRPSAPLARWEGPGHVIAGRDLKSGGSWLGVSEEGRFAVVTNVSGEGLAEPGRASRGALVSDFLAGERRYASLAESGLPSFNAFNLITVDRRGAQFLSNRPMPVRQMLKAGLYGMSNGALDEPWPKTLWLKQRLRRWIDSDLAFFEILLDDLRCEEPALPGAADPGSLLEAERSPVFIRDPDYGTRCSTLVAIDHQGRGTMIERRYDPAGSLDGETHLSFSWPG